VLVVAERFRTDKGYHTQFDVQAIETGPIPKPLIIGERRVRPLEKVFPMIGPVEPPAVAAILNDAFKALTMAAVMQLANLQAYTEYVQTQIAEHLVPLKYEEWFEEQKMAAEAALGDQQ